MKKYRLYKGAWIWNKGPHLENELSLEDIATLLNGGGYFVRNIFDFDCDQTDFWYVIKDKFGGLDELTSRDRGKVRKALKTFNISPIDKDMMKEFGYDLYLSAASHYKVKADIPSKEEYLRRLEDADTSFEYWGCIDKENGKLVAFSLNHIVDGFCDYQTLKADPTYLNKYPFYGLFYEMNRHYLEVRNMMYVSDGARSMSEHSNIQPFLIERFHFRKAYCKMHIAYKSWFGIIVKLLYPFRNVIPVLSVRSLLKMEEINRTFNNDKTIQML